MTIDCVTAAPTGHSPGRRDAAMRMRGMEGHHFLRLGHDPGPAVRRDGEQERPLTPDPPQRRRSGAVQAGVLGRRSRSPVRGSRKVVRDGRRRDGRSSDVDLATLPQTNSRSIDVVSFVPTRRSTRSFSTAATTWSLNRRQPRRLLRDALKKSERVAVEGDAARARDHRRVAGAHRRARPRHHAVARRGSHRSWPTRSRRLRHRNSPWPRH